jgi:chemotaxis-related protein WspB
MLFLLFQLGDVRYALEASRVIEVTPLLALEPLPQAPKGVAGVFNYRGRPVPAVDLCEWTLGRPARPLLSTRIIIVNYPDARGTCHLLGLVAERATELLRKDAGELRDAGLQIGQAPYLGPIFMDSRGAVQCLDERRLLSEPVCDLLFSTMPPLSSEVN